VGRHRDQLHLITVGEENIIASFAEPVTIGTSQNITGANLQRRPPETELIMLMPPRKDLMSKFSPEEYCSPRAGQLAGAILAILLACLLPAWHAAALPDDKDQPIRITADTAIRDEKQGFTVYSGNVHMIQGSLDIVADKLTIYHETAQADKIVAEGKPAKMQQKPAVDEPLVRAHAQVIEYFKNEDRVHLRLDAQITQDGASVTGDSIDYFIEDQLVKATSDQTPQSKQVQVVLPAEVVREEKEETASGPTESD